jgi:hypothetical protein
MVYLAHRLPIESSSIPGHAEQSVPPVVMNLLPATSVHPAAVAVPAIAASWLVLGAWAVFGGVDTVTVLAMVTVVLIMYGGLMLAGGAFAHDATPDRARTRTFKAFLSGRVDTATGPITGREAFMEIASMPVILAVGSTAILAIAALTGF